MSVNQPPGEGVEGLNGGRVNPVEPGAFTVTVVEHSVDVEHDDVHVLVYEADGKVT